MLQKVTKSAPFGSTYTKKKLERYKKLQKDKRFSLPKSKYPNT